MSVDGLTPIVSSMMIAVLSAALFIAPITAVFSCAPTLGRTLNLAWNIMAYAISILLNGECRAWDGDCTHSRIETEARWWDRC